MMGTEPVGSALPVSPCRSRENDNVSRTVRATPNHAGASLRSTSSTYAASGPRG